MVLRTAVRSGFAAVMLLGLAATGVTAQEASPEAGPGGPPLPAGCSVVASDLVVPRFDAVADDGTIYVTEAGIGGGESFVDPLAAEEESAEEESAGEATPVPQLTEDTPLAEQEAEAAPLQTRGFTGRVSAIAADGTVSVLAEGFASYSGGVGPGGIAIGPDGMVYIVVGGSAVLAGLEPLEGENTLFRIDPATGEATAVAELGSYEVANNPDGTDVNPNLYGPALGADGMLYVTDAGGNTIYRVDPATGGFSLLAVLPGVEPPAGATPADPANPSSGARQAVPTGVTFSEDLGLHVVQLSEFWSEGAASVLPVGDDGNLTEVGGPLFLAVALTVGPDGSFYEPQLFSGFEGEQPGPGNVLRIDDGSTEVVVDGLALPHGGPFDADGNLYLAVGSIVTGSEGPPGQLLRCESIAGA